MKNVLYSIMLVLLTATVLTGCQGLKSVRYIDPADPLTGYFQIVEHRRNKSQPETVIPVLKIDGTYHSVCRGFEVPFKQAPDGLKWAMEGSSMVGTTIGRHPDGNLFIIIRDSQSEMFTGDSDHSHNTGLRPMKRISRPASVLDPTSPPPHSNDDFTGCYQPLWFPYYRITIRKEGQKYLATAVILIEEKWGPDRDVVELVPFESGAGFSHFDKRHSIEYNESLKRFEMVKTTSPPIRMPLLRIKPTQPTESISEVISIGIPSWH